MMPWFRKLFISKFKSSISPGFMSMGRDACSGDGISLKGMEYPRIAFRTWMSEVSDSHSSRWFARLPPTKLSGVISDQCRKVAQCYIILSPEIFVAHLLHCYFGNTLLIFHLSLPPFWTIALVTMVTATALELPATLSTMVIAIAPTIAFTKAVITPILSHPSNCSCLVLKFFGLFDGVGAKQRCHLHCVTSCTAGWVETSDCFLSLIFCPGMPGWMLPKWAWWHPSSF